MYTVGVFYAWDFLILILMTLIYFYCPSKYINKKNEYIKFFLVNFSIYFSLVLVFYNISRNMELSHFLFFTFLLPFTYCTHLFYPFKEVKRNQNLNFFLFFLSIYIILVFGFKFLVFAFSNMG